MIPLVPSSALKQQASSALSGRWSAAIVATIIYNLITQITAVFQNAKNQYAENTMSDMSSGAELILALILLIFAIVIFIIRGPLEYGYNGVFLRIRDGREASAGNLFDGFQMFESNVFLGIRKQIFLFLWTLLLIVPGIIKAYSYSMSFYIKNDCPELSAKEAMDLSRRLMDGYKGTLFMLQLSFIGWCILSVFTCGILLVVYVEPKMNAATAEFYNYYIRPRLNETPEDYPVI